MEVKITFEGKKKGDLKYPAKDVRGWVLKELKKECRRVFDIANKRIGRLDSSGLGSPAVHSVMNSGGKFYVKGLGWNQLYKEYRRCINFLNMPTSTVTGARQEKRRIEQLLGRPLSDAQEKTLFKAYHELQKSSPGGVQAYGSERLIQYLADEISSEDSSIMDGTDVDFAAYVERSLSEVQAYYEAAMEELYAAFENTDIFS